MSGTTSLGVYLRDLRARRGLSLDEVARLTRVASRYIEALEADAYGALPAPVFTRGYIRAYCQALHEPVEEALALYHSQSGRTLPPTQPVRAATAAPPPAENEARSRSTVLVSFILLVILGLALFGVTLALQSGRDAPEKRTVDTNASPSLSPSSAATPPATHAATEPPSPPSPPVSEVVVAPPPVAAPRAISPPPVATAHASPPAVVSAHTAPPPSPPPAASPPPPPAAPPVTPDLSGVVASVTSPYRLVARVSEPTWIRVRTEDGRLTEETVPAGQVREWVSNGPFVLTIGNAGGVSFELNGRVLPALGPSGAVISRLVLPPQQ
jgi:cytoskeleton protein RodZ